jgi:predicted  nucleic acid-binding Zn-ribbon protein
MKNRELQSSLVKSGIILILCIFFIYAFAADDSGGVTGTISSLFSATLFLIGLTVAIAVSIAVMFGIYFGILFLYDAETCSKTYAEFKDKFADSTKFISSACATKCSSKKAAVVATLSDEDLSPLRSNQDKLGSQISGLQDSVAGLEKTLSSVSSSITGATEEIAKLDEKVASAGEELESKATTASVEEATKNLTADITAIQGSVKPLSDKLAELETTLASMGTEDDSSDDDLQEKVDTAISGMKKELATMQSSIKSLAAAPPAAAAPAAKKAKPAAKKAEEAPHKILSYFKKKADENKFVKLVDEAVKEGMTYAQVGDFLNESLSAEASKVTSGHPSLTKDYIKTCRKNS